MSKGSMFTLIFFGALMVCCQSGNKTRNPQGNTVYYDPSVEAFGNPMMGFRKGRYLQDESFPAGEYATTIHHNIKYTDLEYSPDDTAQKIKDWSDKTWNGIEKRNIKIIPRVVIVYPNGPDNGSDGYWPLGIDHSDPLNRWTSETFKQRIAKFIEKLGEAWDNDPRVAAVEAGIWGNWGEHHIHPLKFTDGSDRIPVDIQKVMGDAFTKAFKKKKIMVRYPAEFIDFDFGFYWDSFALPEEQDCGELIIKRDVWRTQMIGGEVAYDWGDQDAVGHNPNGSLSNDKTTAHIIDWIEMTHASSLGWIADYDEKNSTIAANAAKMQKVFGYRFVVQQAAFDRIFEPGGKLSIEFNVTNTGSAPFYYPWPVELSLLDEQKNPVWKDIVGVDIRNWRPKHVYTVRDEFKLPSDVKNGTYTLALAILDPAGNLPSIRFANVNYYKGGRMPLGKVGVGRPPNTDDLGVFNSIYTDRSLQYIVEPESAPVADKQHYPPEDDPPPRMPEVHTIEKEGNLAFKKPVTVSSTESAYQNFAEKAVDGDPRTRWSSEWKLDPSWIAIDLGTRTTIGRVCLSWEWSYAKEYEIQVSDDGTNWKTAYHTSNGKGNEEEIKFTPTSARYVRVYLIQRALQWGYSLYEIEIYAQ
jgi:hypothetical protein